jgi:hypothetical protein
MPDAQAGEMVRRVDAPKMPADGLEVAHVGRVEQHALRQHVGNVLARAVHQVVDDHDTRVALGELTDELRADEAGAAGDEDGVAIHRCVMDRGAEAPPLQS